MTKSLPSEHHHQRQYTKGCNSGRRELNPKGRNGYKKRIGEQRSVKMLANNH